MPPLTDIARAIRDKAKSLPIHLQGTGPPSESLPVAPPPHGSVDARPATNYASQTEYVEKVRRKIERLGLGDRLRVLETPAHIRERLATVGDVPPCPAEDAILDHLCAGPVCHGDLVRTAMSAGANEGGARLIVKRLQSAGLIGHNLTTGYVLGHKFLPPLPESISPQNP